jgi:hypothetical protein
MVLTIEDSEADLNGTPRPSNCKMCGEPLLDMEVMFKIHGYYGPCPKAPLYAPHQRRVIGEKEELDKKANALSQFIGHNDTFTSLPETEQELLREQWEIMWQYSEILGKRIAGFVKREN